MTENDYNLSESSLSVRDMSREITLSNALGTPVSRSIVPAAGTRDLNLFIFPLGIYTSTADPRLLSSICADAFVHTKYRTHTGAEYVETSLALSLIVASVNA